MTAPGPGSAPAGGRRSDVALRIGSSLVLIPIALAGAWWGSWPAYVLCALVSVIVFAEWTHVIDRSASLMPDTVEAGVGAAFVVLAALFTGYAGPATGLGIALAGALGVALLSRSAWLVFGSVYAALLGVSLAAIRSDPQYGLTAIVLLLVVVWATDSAAFFVGRTLGGPKLWPRVSPKKTWSGSIGGLAGGVGIAALLAAVLSVPVTPGLILVLVVLSLLSEAGDLFESAVKRRFHKKDSSGIIPGHGGMMDRVDGLLVSAVAAMLLGWAHAGGNAIGRGVLFW